MGSQRGMINNKEKQASAGNWGHPRKYTKKHTKISEPLVGENRHKSQKRKKKKEVKQYISPYDKCPFCDTFLPTDTEALQKMQEGSSLGIALWNRPRVETCPTCKACKVQDPDCCPACKSACFGVWKNIEGAYKHQYLGCGFTGKRKEKP